jgi:hypothetical protein
MKMLIVATALLAALSAPVSAEKQASCDQIAGIAKSIMVAHQKGVSMATMMGIAKGKDLIEKMTVDAYESNRYFTKEIQQRKIEDFRDRWYLWCFKDKNK